MTIQEKAIDAIVVMSTAITNLRLYPPTSAMISQTLERLLAALMSILEEQDPLIIAEADKALIIAGEAASPRNQERPQVRAIVDLMTNLGLKSVSFEKGIEKEELTALLETLSLKPEQIKAEGGLQEILFRRDLLHIRIDEKIYIAKDSNQQIVASLDVRDDDILKFLMETDPEAADLEQVREKAKDPEWITSIFQTGMKHIEEQRGSLPDSQLSDSIVQLVRLLEKMADPGDLDRIVQLISRSIMEMDSDMIGLVLSHDIRTIFGGRLFDGMVEDLEEERFAAVVDELEGLATGQDDRGRSAAASLAALMGTDKGQKLKSEREARAAREKEEKEKRLAFLRQRMGEFIQEGRILVFDGDAAAEMPAVSRELHSLGDDGTADAPVEPLIQLLHSRNPVERNRSAEVLSQMLSDHLAEGRAEWAGRLTEQLTGYLRTETVFSSTFEKICLQLKELGRTVLTRNPFLEVNPILDTLSLIQSGRSPKEPSMSALAAAALGELAAPELLEALFGELKTDRKGKRKEAARTLGRLGVAPLETLLDILRDSDDSDERVRILQIVYEIGSPAIPAITARMVQDAPWYVLRNLVYLLGRVGGEAQAVNLAPLLLHENPKVQTEAMKSLQRIGGKVRAETLLSVLSKADAAFKLNIVEMLGTIKAQAAVPALVALLCSKSASSTKPDLDEKICLALGNIGSEEALPALKEMSASKGFFGVLSSKDKVRLAAEKAIVAIARRKP